MSWSPPETLQGVTQKEEAGALIPLLPPGRGSPQSRTRASSSGLPGSGLNGFQVSQRPGARKPGSCRRPRQGLCRLGSCPPGCRWSPRGPREALLAQETPAWVPRVHQAVLEC